MAFILIAMNAKGYDFSADEKLPDTDIWVKLYYQINPDGNTVSVAAPTTPYADQVIVIPATVMNEGKTYTVNAIAANAFKSSKVRQITLPNTITQIKSNAFYQSSLNSITLSSKLESIGDNCFSETQLPAIELPEGVASIGESAFSKCTKLQSINLPSTINFIGNRAFYSSGIIKISVPGSVKTINSNAFANCQNLTEIELGEGVEYLDEYAFSGSVKSIKLPKTLKYIGYRCFWESKLTGELILPEGLESIGIEAFRYNPYVTSVTLPSTLTTLGDMAFSYCAAIESINFPASLRTIPKNTCYSCKSLSKVTIAEGIESINENAFGECESLTSIQLPSTLNEFIGGGQFTNTGLSKLDLPANIKELPASLFSGCKNLTSFVVPDHIISVGNYAFSNCSSLEIIILPDHITEIPEGFVQGTAIKTFKCPKSLKTVGKYAFRDCYTLSDITFNDELVEIGQYAFWDCKSLTELKMPNSVKTFGTSIVNGCTTLEKFYFPPQINYRFDGYSYGLFFQQNPALKEVYVPIGTPKLGSTMIDPSNDVTLYVPIGSKSAYEQAEGWKNFRNIVEIEMEDIDFTMKVGIAGSGSVSINGVKVASYGNLSIKQGDEAKIEFTPQNELWKVASVIINDTDVTSKLIDNTYTINSVETNYSIEVTFERAPVNVTIYSGDDGEITIPVKYNSDLDIYLRAQGEWVVDNVTKDGSVVTSSLSDDGLLTLKSVISPLKIYVTYTQKQSYQANLSVDSNILIYGDNSGIIIKGLEKGDTYKIFSPDGRLVTDGISNGDDYLTIKLPIGQVYIIQTQYKTVKIRI